MGEEWKRRIEDQYYLHELLCTGALSWRKESLACRVGLSWHPQPQSAWQMAVMRCLPTVA